MDPDILLLEDGDALLLEDGTDNLLLEFGSDAPPDYEVCVHGKDYRTVTMMGANHRSRAISGKDHRTVTLTGSSAGAC